MSLRRRIGVLGAASIVALTLAIVGFASSSQNPTLIGFVGTNDGFDIGLTDANGTPVTRVTPGTYTFLIRDRSRFHNFHFASNQDRTVDFRTELDFVGEQSFTVTLQNDTQYAYACEPHWQTMNGQLFSTNGGAQAQAEDAARGRHGRRHGVRVVASSEGRSLSRGRPRRLEAPQLPPRRPGREQAHDRRVQGNGDVDPPPQARHVSLRQRSRTARRPPARALIRAVRVK
jgi:hypothetical protein